MGGLGVANSQFQNHAASVPFGVEEPSVPFGVRNSASGAPSGVEMFCG